VADGRIAIAERGKERSIEEMVGEDGSDGEIVQSTVDVEVKLEVVVSRVE